MAKDNNDAGINIMIAFNIPERDCENTYSNNDMGAINILVKLSDHIFQRLPTDTEYWMMKIISHKSIPVRSEYAILFCTEPDKNNARNPNTMTDMIGKIRISNITSFE
jgi:hypothetical protein